MAPSLVRRSLQISPLSTTSSMYQQSPLSHKHGQAERSVQTVKRLLSNSHDPFLALLSYRATPLPWSGKSPAELLMGRRLSSNLPETSANLVPQWPYLQDFRVCNEQFKARQKADYDQRHRVRDLPALPNDTNVWVTSGGHPTRGQTMTTAHTPRSYIVQTPNGEIRRNRSHLNVDPQPTVQTTIQPNTASDRSPIRTRTRTGARITPPDRLA